MDKQFLVLIGSPKIGSSASDFIAGIFIDSLKRQGVCPSVQYVYKLSREKNGMNDLNSMLLDTEGVIFINPLYIDMPPYEVIKMMEFLVENRQGKCANPTRLVVVSNGGYPESIHSNYALMMCKEFGDMAKFKWVMGLSIGMGAMMNVRMFQKCGFLFDKIRAQIDCISRDLVNDKNSFEQKLFIESVPFVPTWLYFLGARIAPWVMADKHAITRMYARPYGSDVMHL